MTDLETATRQAIATLRMRYRVEQIPAADDEALAAIMRAANPDQGLGLRPGPIASMFTPARDPEQAALKARIAEIEALAAEVVGTFTEGKDGHWRAHVGAGRIEEWRERLARP